SFCNREALEEGEIKIPITRPIHLRIRSSQRRQARLSDTRHHRRIGERGWIVKVRNPASIPAHTWDHRRVRVNPRSRANLATDRLRLPAVEAENRVRAPTSQHRLFDAVHIPEKILAVSN